MPCLPVALNSGLFWPRRRFIRRPGTIRRRNPRPDPARNAPRRLLPGNAGPDRDRQRPPLREGLANSGRRPARRHSRLWPRVPFRRGETRGPSDGVLALAEGGACRSVLTFEFASTTLEQMTNKRIVSWSMAMRDLRNERTRRAGVREERLRATAGLRSSPGLEFLARPVRPALYRGRPSPRRLRGHGCHRRGDPGGQAGAERHLARRRHGHRRSAASGEARARWLARVRAAGATEMHVHRLADDDQERRAVIADLDQGEPDAC